MESEPTAWLTSPVDHEQSPSLADIVTLGETDDNAGWLGDATNDEASNQYYRDLNEKYTRAEMFRKIKSLEEVKKAILAKLKVDTMEESVK